MRRIKILVISLMLVILNFLFFWRSTFSLFSSKDFSFLIIYIAVLMCGLMVMYIKEFSRKVIPYILAVILCLGTFIALFMYREWNKEGYYINVDDVEKIEYMFYSEKEIDGNNTVRLSYTSSKEDIIANYNGAVCIKKWTDLGDAGTTDRYLYIFMKDGSCISIDESGGVHKINKEKGISEQYRTDKEFDEFLY